ncbi:DUF6578 domain-containing protein [Streptomyces sp. NPDC002755]|uniref:DUF6578 domain-containing protein n=1 Tax=Streptomyces sp. NPDC002884 TaxID=3154544 RepID=UPI00332F805F
MESAGGGPGGLRRRRRQGTCNWDRLREEHHGQEGEQTTTLLEALTITDRYAVPPASTTNVQGPVLGTTELVPVSEANGWAESRPDISFAGYLVTARATKTEA